MQIAATNPLSIKRDDVDKSLLEREKAIFSEQAKESGKPENILDKIVEGRVEKFFTESCLLEQQFIKDPERKVIDLLTEAVATLGENIIINRFTRYAIGESSDNGQSQ
jgi:elongation factor Ts